MQGSDDPAEFGATTPSALQRSDLQSSSLLSQVFCRQVLTPGPELSSGCNSFHFIPSSLKHFRTSQIHQRQYIPIGRIQRGLSACARANILGTVSYVWDFHHVQSASSACQALLARTSIIMHFKNHMPLTPSCRFTSNIKAPFSMTRPFTYSLHHEGHTMLRSQRPIRSVESPHCIPHTPGSSISPLATALPHVMTHLKHPTSTSSRIHILSSACMSTTKSSGPAVLPPARQPMKLLG
jgi:hypothetical protein